MSGQMAHASITRRAARSNLKPCSSVRLVRRPHGGSNVGYQCLMLGYLDGQGAVVMTDGDRGGALAGEIMRSISAEYGWPDHKPSNGAGRKQ